MQSEAIYDNVENHISAEIRKAKKSVFIADARFDNKDIFKELVRKAKAGCLVSLIISEDSYHKTQNINYRLLEKYGSGCMIIGDGGKELMHYNLCIIDSSTVITGYYDLNGKTGRNFENLIINYNDTALAGQILSLFSRVRNHFNKVGRNSISDSELLVSRDDPEIMAMQLEVKILENQLSVFENEKIEHEKLLSDFYYRHTVELGDIILEILKLKKLRYIKYSEKHDEAERDYKKYSKQIIEEKKKTRFELGREEKVELKRKFRKATLMCHPDKVGEKYKDSAQSIFIELKTAYEVNDLKKVTEILNILEKGNLFKPVSDTISEKVKLSSVISKLILRVKTLVSEIYAIRLSEAYKTISNTEDLDAYFVKTRELLINELEELRAETDNQISDLINYDPV